MESLKLKAEVRQATGRKVKQLRQQGIVPAVLYGHGSEATSLQISAKSLAKVLAQAGTHQLIALEIDKQKPQMTLARDIQRDVIRRNYMHVDFYAVRMDEKVTAQVPLVMVGVSPAVKDKGGILTQGLDELEIECFPADLISAIEIPIGGLLEFNDTIHVSQLTVPDTVTILSDLDSMVVKIEAPRKIEELDALDETVEEGAVPTVQTAAEEE